jgi:type IV secretion system protein VirB6/type IV secretion system protein TrbL
MWSLPTLTPAAEGGGGEKIIDQTLELYRQAASAWEPRLKQTARHIFWILATISLVFTFGYMAVRGNAGVGDFFGEFLHFGVTTGFFYWLLDNGSSIAKAILASFMRLGQEAAPGFHSELTPSSLLSLALDLVGRSTAAFGEQDAATSVMLLLLSLAIAVLFALIASLMVLLLCSAWLLVYAGVIYLGFGGGRWTSDLAVNYFRSVLGLGVQTLVFCLLAGIGQSQLEKLLQEGTRLKDVTLRGYVYDSTVQTTALTLTDAAVILVFSVVLFMLVNHVPGMVASLATGGTGVFHSPGAGPLRAGAGAILTGGALLAHQTAGLGLALSRATRQAGENWENAAGRFTSPPSGGGLGQGVAFAADVLDNLLNGIRQSHTDRLEKTTWGGRVAAALENGSVASVSGSRTNPSAGAPLPPPPPPALAPALSTPPPSPDPGDGWAPAEEEPAVED